MLARLAASTIRVPLGTLTCWPSMVSVTRFGASGMCGNLCYGAFVSQGVLLVLVAEVPHRGHDHPARRVAQAAEAASELQALLDAVQDLQVDRAAVAAQDALERAHGPVAAHAARRALAARLVRIEAEQPVGRLHHAVRVVHHDHAA